MTQLNQGCSVSSIAQQYGRNRQTIYDLEKKEKQSGTIERKVKVDEETRRRIIEIIRVTPTTSPRKIKQQLDLRVSVSTIRTVIVSYQNQGLVPIKEEVIYPIETGAPTIEVLDDDIKEEFESQFGPDDPSSGEDHVVNSILYMGKIYNPDLTIGKV